FQCFHTVFGFFHHISFTLEIHLQQAADPLFIIHYKNCNFFRHPNPSNFHLYNFHCTDKGSKNKRKAFSMKGKGFCRQAYECSPAIIKLTATELNMMMTKPITASQADFSPAQPLPSRKCKYAA